MLVINPAGVIRKLYTPFRVTCIIPVADIPLHAWVYVDEVWCNVQDELYFIIFGQIHHYRHFKIAVCF
ncbi:hypothetical protein FLA_2193 [Filimonas lacunae]|nr:hypothetical protein FLA_2193 [Filimonas lacunae]